MARIYWTNDVPAEVRAALEPMLDRWTGLLPTWLHDLVVDYSATEQAGMLMGVEFHYRRANLIVTGQWLTCPPEEREEMLRHELSHIILGPLQDIALDIVRRLTDEDDALADYLRQEVMNRVEGVTCDMSHAIFQTATDWRP
jgi:hypothetical protein